MSQRHSEYDRIAGDTYVTPRWVYEALYTVEPWAEDAFEAAPVDYKHDFFSLPRVNDDICTNPPFRLAEKFVRHALKMADRVAMLLPMNWDAAKTRRDLFENPRFRAKYVITKRIRWENLAQKKNGPSTNHAWFVWDKPTDMVPFIGYLPKQESPV